MLMESEKKLPALDYNDMPGESIKPVLNMLGVYKPNHECHLFSIHDTNDIPEDLITATATIQDPKYNVGPNKLVT